jgi:N6-adenosine-specific RNA methylase IME4
MVMTCDRVILVRTQKSSAAVLITATAPNVPSVPAIQESDWCKQLPDGRWVTTGGIEKLNESLHLFAAENGPADVIVLDRPWAYGKTPGSAAGATWTSGPEFKYPLLADKDSLALDLRSLCKKNSTVYEWVPSSQLKFLLEIWAKAGVVFVGTTVWHKLKKSGKSHRCASNDLENCHELLVLGRFGEGTKRRDLVAKNRIMQPYISKHLPALLVQAGDSQEKQKKARQEVRKEAYKLARPKMQAAQKLMTRIPGVFKLPAGVHSRKPAEVQQWIKSLYGNDGVVYAEIFGRGAVPGWNVFGNQAGTPEADDGEIESDEDEEMDEDEREFCYED